MERSCYDIVNIKTKEFDSLVEKLINEDTALTWEFAIDNILKIPDISELGIGIKINNKQLLPQV